MAQRIIRAAFSLCKSRAVMSGAGSRFADAGKTVKIGHSGAAVTGHDLTTHQAVMPGVQSQSGGNSR
jgi:hypothetical protein